MVCGQADTGGNLSMTGGCVYRHGGKEYWLVYTADAYFELNERYGTDFFGKIRPVGREAYDIAVGCLCVLAREGELCRRYMGYDPLPMLDEETIRRTVLADGVVQLKNTVMDAILAGLHIEVEEKQENGGKKEPVDIGLLEFEKKTKLG